MSNNNLKRAREQLDGLYEIVKQTRNSHEEISFSFEGEIRNIENVLEYGNLSEKDRQFFENQHFYLKMLRSKEYDDFDYILGDISRRIELTENEIEQLEHGTNDDVTEEIDEK